MKKLLLLSIFLISALGHAAFSAEGEPPFVAAAGEDGVQRVEVLAGSYFFKPDHIIVKAGVPVELKVKQKPSIVPHNIVMKEKEAGMKFFVRLTASAKRVTFTPEETGKFAFYCDRRFLFFKSHRARGMEGVIEVVE
ncbi:MAG: cupredoxin domain-containing protein [Thermodesulfobacteriota bacterium]